MTVNLKEYFAAKTEDLVELTADLVAIESPTDDKAAVDRVGQRVRAELESLGAAITVHPRAEVGDILEARWNEGVGGQPLLIVSHMDTVHPVGAIEDNPVRREAGNLFGPGTYDMKGSIAVVLTAIRGLQTLGSLPDRPIIALMTTDEETGSFHSRDLIQERAADAALSLVTEAALPDGALKTWRKSVGRFTLRASGIASHAGGAHESGCNAIEEMAHHILALQRMTNYKIGTTVNVGVIEGGTKSNVVPDTCTLEVDVRAMTEEEMTRLTARILDLSPVLPGAELEVEGGFDRPPMVRDEQMRATFRRAKQIAEEVGLTLRDGGTGGASDGNYTAAIGTPTLDGLGPLGDGAHSEREMVRIDSLPERATLLAALIRDWPPAD